MLKAIQKQALEHAARQSRNTPLASKCSLTINFHPDRITLSGEPLLAAMAADGQLKSQFETGTSNGGLSAHIGGERWQWEDKAFGGIYNHCAASERPVYGALNYQHHPAGACPRFGSSYFRLRSEVLARSSFCYPDSYFNPQDYSDISGAGHLVALAKQSAEDALDVYVEAQIHGTVELTKDIEALVLDPCYKDTEVEALARQLPCQLEWHAGFAISTEALWHYPNYRGPQYLRLAEQIAEQGVLSPRVIGQALEHFDAQDLKKVWHYLARFGYRG